jgi:hypothetical protein
LISFIQIFYSILFYFSVITDLIKEANETKGAIQEATSAMQNANETSHNTEQKKNDAMAMSTNFESNLFDYAGTAPPAAPQQQQQQQPDTMNSTNAPLPDMYSSSQPPAPMMQSSMPPPESLVMVQTVSSDGEDGGVKVVKDDDAPELFSNEYGQPEPSGPAPPQEQQQQQQAAPSQQYQAPPTPQYEQPSVYSQPPPGSLPPSAQPSPAVSRPPAVRAHHPRQSSLGFNPDFIMGGSAEPLPDGMSEAGISPAARTKSSSADFGYDDEELFSDVEEMKKQAQSAGEAARDAEAAHQRLLNEANELREDADKAEATARSLKAASSEKKKKRFGGSGDKKKILVRITLQ